MFRWLTNALRKEEIKPTPVIPPPTSWVKKFADEMEEERRFTPDLPELERETEHMVFIYNEFQTGHHKHHLLDGCVKSEYAAFTHNPMMMLTNDLGIFTHPLAFDTDLGYHKPPPMLPIKGELYKIPPRKFLELDSHMLNTEQSYRRKASIVVPYEQIFIKDRALGEKLIGRQTAADPKNVAVLRKRNPKMAPAEAAEQLRGNTFNSCFVKHKGVHRIFAWMYYSDRYFWEDLLQISAKNRPAYFYENKDGLIKKYYCFTNAEYNRGKTDPPWV